MIFLLKHRSQLACVRPEVTVMIPAVCLMVIGPKIGCLLFVVKLACRQAPEQVGRCVPRFTQFGENGLHPP